MHIDKAYYNLTIRQYIELNDIPEDKWVEKVQYLVKKDLSIGEAARLYERFKQLESSVPKKKTKSFYVVNRSIYRVNYKLSEIRTDQFIDLLHFASKDNVVAEIHNILAIFFKPIFTKEYNGLKHEEIAKNLLDMKLIDAIPVMVFFCNYLRVLSESIPTYLKAVKESLTHL
jgi:hypothetical protein